MRQLRTIQVYQCSTILVVFLGFYPGRPGLNLQYEQTTKFIPVTEPARLPDLYEARGPYIRNLRRIIDG